MTDSSPCASRQIQIDSGWSVPDDGRVGRRTIVQGAAWTIPVVAVAVATPAAAASQQPTLAFTQPSYSGTGCGVISGVQVERTTDGTTPAAGQVISVTLSDGYTFSDGSTTYSATSGADGTITLPDIEVPAGGGTSAFAASSGTLTATAPVSSTATDTGDAIYGGGNTPLALVPNGLHVLDLAVAEEPDSSNDKLIADIVASDGTRWFWDRNSNSWTQRTGGPAAQQVATTTNTKGGAAHYVFTNGASIYGRDGSLVTSTPNGQAVTDISLSERFTDGDLLMDVITTDGSRFRYDSNTGTWTQQTGGPVGEHVSTQTDIGGIAPHSTYSNGGNIYSAGGGLITSVPNGLSIRDYSVSEQQNGDLILDVIASDGTRWRWNRTTGLWEQKTGGPAPEHISTENNLGGGETHYVVSGPAPCS